MAITFACSCGQPLRAGAEFAGRQVKCPACGQVVTAPALQAAPAPAGDATGALFACPCGQKMKGQREHAGRQTKCPSCGRVLVIPAPAAVQVPKPAPKPTAPKLAAAPPKKTAPELAIAPPRKPTPSRAATPVKKPAPDLTAAAPKPRRPAPALEEPDFEDQPAPRAGRSRPRRKSPLLLVAACVAGVLLLAGLGVYWLSPKKESPGGGGTGGGSSAFGDSSLTALDVVPRDAVAFASVRVAEVWNHDEVKKARQQPEFSQAEELMTKELGLSPAEVEQVVLVGTDVKSRELVLVVALSAPRDPEKWVKQFDPDAKPKAGKERAYTLSEKHGGMALHFLHDRLLVAGPDAQVQKLLDAGPRQKDDGPLRDAVRLAREPHHVFAAVNVVPEMRDEAGRAFGLEKNHPLLPLAEATSATLAVDLGKDVEADLRLLFPDDAKAKKAAEAALGGLAMVRLNLAQLKGVGLTPELLTKIDAFLDLPVQPQGKEVRVKAKLDAATASALVTGVLVPSLFKMGSDPVPKKGSEPGGDGPGKPAKNLEQLGRAMYNYEQARGCFPPAGLAGLSWRVRVLPYLDDEECTRLYKQFDLDKPWDSPENKKLLDKMPKVFQCPGRAAGPGMTYFQVFVGPDAPFKAGNQFPGPKAVEFTDGLSHTFLIAEAAGAVEWTRPADLPFTKGGMPPALGDPAAKVFLVFMADGEVRPVRKDLDPKTLKALINPRDGVPVDLNKIGP